LRVAVNLFTSQGFDATPTAQISKEANISTGTLFHYFPNKNSILDQLYLSVKKGMSAIVSRDDDQAIPPRKRLFLFVRNYTEWAIANPEEFLFLDQFYHSPSISEKVQKETHDEFEWLTNMIRVGIDAGILKEPSVEFNLVMITSILYGIITLIKSGKTGLSNEQIVHSGFEMLLKK
jgi:AcrR family transcriptional regulator